MTPGRPGLALVLTLALFVAPWPADSADSSAPPVRLSGVSYLGDLPTLVAQQRDLFSQQGLTVQVSRDLSGNQNLQTLLAGETDFALMSPAPFVLERLDHPGPPGPGDPVILASLVRSVYINHVVTLQGLGIETPADLIGRRVGLMQGTNADFLWWLFAAYHELPLDAVERVDYPIEEVTDALVNGQIDAAVIWEPWSSRLAAQVGERLLLLPGSDIYADKWLLVTTRGFAESRPETAQRILAAYREAIRFIDTHPYEAMALHAQDAGAATDGALTSRHPPLFGLSLDWSLLNMLQEHVAWARAVGYADPAGGETDLLSWFERGPLEQVSPATVGIPRRPGDAQGTPP